MVQSLVALAYFFFVCCFFCFLLFSDSLVQISAVVAGGMVKKCDFIELGFETGCTKTVCIWRVGMLSSKRSPHEN